MTQAVMINSENVLEKLRQLVEHPEQIDNKHIEIGDIAPIEIKLIGDIFHNSITSTVMRGLLELQESVYRSFAMAKYGNDSLSNLSSHEKERLELIVQIYPGCTELVAEIRGLVREIKELLIDMSPKEKLAFFGMFLLGLFGIIGALQVESYYVEKDKNYKEIQLQKDENATKVEIEKQRTEQLKATQEGMQKAFEAGIKSQRSDSETKDNQNEKNASQPAASDTKANIPAHASENYFKTIKSIPQDAQDIIDRVRAEYPNESRAALVVNKGVEKLIHATSQANIVKYNNTFAMSGDVAKKISFEPRASSNQIALNDKFRVLDLDAKRTDLRKTRLRSSKGVEFSAEFTDGSIGKTKMDKLLQAFKGYHPIDLSIEARDLRGKITGAIITQVRDVDTTFSFKDQEEV
ncbi:hypothetical protein E6P72_11195 [Moraxella osloensis]|nr:hypothetical protein [Moraxella osloensis]MDI4481634.1 hypothetical protein [Moraxella osloensis]